VIGAQGIFGGPGTDPGSQPGDKPAGTTGVWTSLTVNEDATYSATFSKVTGPTGGGAKRVGTLTGTAKAYFKPGLNFKTSKPLANGYYQFSIALKAATNPSRATTLTSKTFKVGSPGGAEGTPGSSGTHVKRPKPGTKCTVNKWKDGRYNTAGVCRLIKHRDGAKCTPKDGKRGSGLYKNNVCVKAKP
jgi:hypothetical protein